MLTLARATLALCLSLGLVAALIGCAPSGGGGGGGGSSASGSTSQGGGSGAGSGSSGGGSGTPTGGAGGTIGVGGSTGLGGGTSGGTSGGTGGTSGGGSPGPQAPAMKVSAWLPDWAGTAGFTTSLNDSAGALDEVNPCWYGVAASGALTRRSIARDTAFVARMHAQGTTVLPMVDDFAINGATPVLTDPVKRALLLDSLVAEVVNYDLDGLDIDFEGLGTAGRDPFREFMTDLAFEMHRRGKKLSVAVYPKTSEPGPWSTSKSHDYPGLGAVVDEFKIMLYSFDGPVAPLTYIESVCGFAKTQMPASKIYAGIPFYGWNKPATGSKTSVTETQANTLLAQVGATLQRDAASQEAKFIYTDSSSVLRTVFFQDAISIGAKCDKAKSMGLAGVAIWRLGGEKRATWDAIRARR